MKRTRKKETPGDPYAVGTVHTVRVEELDGEPAAVARTVDGRRMRVPLGVPGDLLDVRVEAQGRRDLWCRLVSIRRPSPDRVEPPCPLTGTCGACPWQNVRYGEQLRAKGRDLSAAVASRPSLIEAVVHDPIGVSPPVGYRTKIQMPFGGAAGALELGFYAPRSHAFVPVPACVVQHPLAEAARARIAGVLDGQRLAPYDEATGSGDLRYLLLRVAEGTGQVAAVLVVRSLESADWSVVAAALGGISELSGVWLNENPSPGNAVLGERTVHLAGERRLADRLGGRLFERSPTGFFQTNHRATEQLIGLVRELLPPRVGTLLDLYAGGGLFSVVLSDRARRVVLVESHPDAVAAARVSLADAGVENERILLGRAVPMLRRLRDEGARIDAAVVDPPRAGMEAEALEALAALAPPRIIHISCRQRTMLRDAEALVGLGYRLEQVRAVDMFPHTPHSETVGLLTRGPAGKEGHHGE